MSALQALRYHAHVSLLGSAVLRWQRLRSERRSPRPHPHLAPPLKVSAWLKELITRHYLVGQHVQGHKKVVWVTSGGPIEFLKALDFFPIYPENHAAVCGIRRRVVEIAGHAEEAGYSRDLCSYARTDIGSVLSGATPVGRLPRPDLLLCCTNICQTVLSWYQVLARHFDVPLIVVDTPFIYDQPSDHAVAFVRRQLEDAIGVAERVAGKSLSQKRLGEVTRLSKLASELWLQVINCAQHRPAPMTAFDQFIHMGPVVEMRGDAVAVDYYGALLAELEQRKADGVGALKNERKRLLWDNLPIWFRLRALSELLAEHGAALVASTYTNAWGELAPMFDPARPLESGARVYLHPILNRGTGLKLETMRQMATSFSVDGAILHSDRSCKPYSIGQAAQRDALAQGLGMPVLLLEADHNDPRAYADEQASNRLEAFFEMLGI